MRFLDIGNQGYIGIGAYADRSKGFQLGDIRQILLTLTGRRGPVFGQEKLQKKAVFRNPR